jgi:hypothetical protein
MRRPTPCRSSATAAEIPALLASQAMTGPIFTGTYGYPGWEIDLIAGDIFPAGHLSALKARLLLGFCSRTQNGSRVPTCALINSHASPHGLFVDVNYGSADGPTGSAPGSATNQEPKTGGTAGAAVARNRAPDKKSGRVG